MEFLQNRSLNNTVKVLCLVAAALMAVIAVVVYGANPASVLVFVLYIVFYLQLPGQLILRILNFYPKHISGYLCVSFYTGWAFILCQYFLVEFIHTNILLLVTGPAMSAIFIFLYIRDRSSMRHYSFHPQKLYTSIFIFAFFVFMYSMLKNQYLYIDPSIDELTYMNADKGFHIGLINTLSHGFPMESPWMSGTTYYYHVFSEMMMSVPTRLFSLPADRVLLSCGPYLTAYALSTPLYAFFRSTCKKPARAGIYCLFFIMSNIFIARGITKSVAFVFILGNENVAGYATGCSITALLLLKYWYDEYAAGRKSWHILILLTASIMLATGIKGPFGLMILAGVWGTFVIGAILRKVPLKTLLPLIIMSAGFILVYIFVLGSKGQAAPGESHLALGRMLNITFYKTPLVEWMKAHGIPLFGRYLVLIVTFAIFMYTAFFLPLVMGYLRELYLVFSGKKEYYLPRVTLYASLLVGFTAMMILKYNGHSQIYFGFVPLMCGVFIAIWFLEDMEDNKGFLMKLVRCVFAVSLVLCAFTLSLYTVGMFRSAIHSSDPTLDNSRYMSLSKSEYEAMRWIDKNTPIDSLLATDRYYSVDPAKYEAMNRWDNRFFLYSDYSNRICYLEGSGYTLPAYKWALREERIKINDRLYDPQDKGRGKLAKKLGIDYVIVSKDFTKPIDLTNDVYKLCFSNDDIDVYEIK